jgi:hypothetical protein
LSILHAFESMPSFVCHALIEFELAIGLQWHLREIFSMIVQISPFVIVSGRHRLLCPYIHEQRQFRNAIDAKGQPPEFSRHSSGSEKKQMAMLNHRDQNP